MIKVYIVMRDVWTQDCLDHDFTKVEKAFILEQAAIKFKNDLTTKAPNDTVYVVETEIDLSIIATH